MKSFLIIMLACCSFSFAFAGQKGQTYLSDINAFSPFYAEASLHPPKKKVPLSWGLFSLILGSILMLALFLAIPILGITIISSLALNPMLVGLSNFWIILMDVLGIATLAVAFIGWLFWFFGKRNRDQNFRMLITGAALGFLGLFLFVSRRVD